MSFRGSSRFSSNGFRPFRSRGSGPPRGGGRSFSPEYERPMRRSPSPDDGFVSRSGGMGGGYFSGRGSYYRGGGSDFVYRGRGRGDFRDFNRGGGGYGGSRPYFRGRGHIDFRENRMPYKRDYETGQPFRRDYGGPPMGHGDEPAFPRKRYYSPGPDGRDREMSPPRYRYERPERQSRYSPPPRFPYSGGAGGRSGAMIDEPPSPPLPPPRRRFSPGPLSSFRGSRGRGGFRRFDEEPPMMGGDRRPRYEDRRPPFRRGPPMDDREGRHRSSDRRRPAEDWGDSGFPGPSLPSKRSRSDFLDADHRSAGRDSPSD